MTPPSLRNGNRNRKHRRVCESRQWLRLCIDGPLRRPTQTAWSALNQITRASDPKGMAIAYRYPGQYFDEECNRSGLTNLNNVKSRVRPSTL